VGEADAGQDEKAAEDLGEAERFAEEDCGHGGGQRALGEKTDGRERSGKMAQSVGEEEIAAELGDERPRPRMAQMVRPCGTRNEMPMARLISRRASVLEIMAMRKNASVPVSCEFFPSP